MDREARSRAVRRVLWVTLALNLAVAGSKLGYGYFAELVSLQAEGFHSAFDALSNIIGLVPLGVARKPADTEHPYGHRKLEAAASLIIGLMVLLGMLEVGRAIYDALVAGRQPVVATPAYVILIATIAVNLGVSMYERREGKRLKSMILTSDAAHTLTDSIAALAVLVGLYLVDRGFPQADIVAASLVMVFIGATAFRVLRDGIDVIVDTAHLDATAVRDLVEELPHVRSCHYVRSRGMPGHVHLEFHMSLDADMTLARAGELMLNAKRVVKERYPEVEDVLIQLEPHDAHYVEDVPENLV
jgi:cation diffusion facilitator family transporter